MDRQHKMHRSTDVADDDDIYYAYRLMLGREPDPAGLEHHRRIVADRHPTAHELAKDFLASAEFTERNDKRPVEVRFDGYSLFIRPDDRDIGEHIRATHQYEPHVTAVVRDLLRPGNVFIDVGANVGFFTNLAAHLVGTRGRVVAIEPMDKNLQLIYRALSTNGFDHVQVHACAASDRIEIVSVATGPRTSNGQVLTSAQAQPSNLYAQTRLLDELTTDLPRIDLVKLDIEGYELRAWRGFRRGLERHRPVVLTEFHPLCMRAFVGVEPMDYLAELFAYADTVQSLRYQGGAVECATPAEVMDQWEIGDKAVRGDGTNHLDLLIKPKH